MVISASAFIRKWQRVALTERSASQHHFLDLCDLLDHPKPAEAVFAAYGWPTDLADDEILERLLALNLVRSTVDTERGVGEDQKITGFAVQPLVAPRNRARIRLRLGLRLRPMAFAVTSRRDASRSGRRAGVRLALPARGPALTSGSAARAPGCRRP